MIFNILLAHGVRPNHSDDRVRMAQYISMYPADRDNEDERNERIRLWRERRPPEAAPSRATRANGRRNMREMAKLTRSARSCWA